MVRVHAVPGTSMRDAEGTMAGRGGGDGGDVGNGDEAGRPFCLGHTAPVICMIVDDENTLLATASADRTVRVWDIEGGYCTHSLKGHSGMVLDAVQWSGWADESDDYSRLQQWGSGYIGLRRFAASSRGSVFINTGQ